MSVFTGAGVAIITPFKDDNSVNYDKLTELIEDQIAGGTDAIVSCGTTGEASTLTHEEHIEVIKHTVEVVKGRIPVIAGTGSNSTDTAIYLSKEAEKCGADALLIVTPYYNKATQNGLFGHFKTIADRVKLPIIAYNIPGRTGCLIEAATMARMWREIPNVVGVKDATANLDGVTHLMALTDGEIDVYSGEDALIVPIMAVGGKGVISVLSQVAPRQVHNICEMMLSGDVAGAMKEQRRAIPLIDALFSEVNPIPVKKAMNIMGKEVGPLRLPLTEMEEEHADKLKRVMKEYGLL